MSRFLSGVIAVLFFASVAAWCQLTSPNQTRADSFSSLISSAASFDMDAPIEGRAEFDPPVTSVGGEVLYRVSVTALDESLEVPDPPGAAVGLKFERGGRGQIYEPSGGNKVRPRTTVIFHVKPSASGDYTVPSFQALAYGKKVAIPAATLQVGAGDSSPPPSPPLLQILLPPGNIYVGEMLSVPVAMAETAGIPVGIMTEPKIIGDALFSEQFASPVRETRLLINGRETGAYLLNLSVTPLKQGRQTLVAQVFTYLNRPVPAQPGAMRIANELVDSDPITINVKPVPKEGELPGFLGAVGSFRTDSPLQSTNHVKAGEPVILIVTIRGSGNIGRITPPAAPTDRDWQTFPPVGEDLSPSAAQQLGEIRFTYTMIPLSDRVKSTPPIPFAAFDPVKEAYVDLTIPSAPLKVDPSPIPTSLQMASSPAQLANTPEGEEKEISLAGLVKKPGRRVGSLGAVQQRLWFFAAQAVPAAIIGGLWGWDRRRKFLVAHPEVILKRRARRGLRRQRRLARRAAEARDAAGFVKRAAEALREASAPNGAANPGALVCADVLAALPSEANQNGARDMVTRLFAAADAVRFGGKTGEEAVLLSLQPEVERLLEQMEARL